jgi:hypothetical protein
MVLLIRLFLDYPRKRKNNSVIQFTAKFGRLAQLVEHSLDVGKVTGSKPVSSIQITIKWI